MKTMLAIGMAVLVLGFLSLFIPVPQNDKNSFNVRDVAMSINTKHDEKVPPLVSAVLILDGVGMMIGGSRKNS